MKVQEKLKTKVMEKKEKTIPTQEQINKMVADYLRSSEKHLFQSKYVWDKEYNESNYYKVIPVTLEGKLRYMKIEVSGDNLKVLSVNDTSWIKNKNHLGMFKNIVFPQFVKHKSVKQYTDKVRIRLSWVFYDIKKLAEENPDMTGAEFKELINNKNFKIVM